MRYQKLLVLSITTALLAGIAVVSAAVVNMVSSIANQECVANSCAGTLTQFTGTVLVTAPADDDLPGMVGNVIGSVEGDFNVSLWGDFSITTKTGPTTYGSASVLTLATANSSFCSGSYQANFGSQSILYSPFWEDKGFSLSGSVFCFQDPQRTLWLSLVSPDLGTLTTFSGGSLNSVVIDANGPTMGLAFNGLGLLSEKTNNVKGLKSRLESNYGGADPFTYGSQALSVLSTTITKYDYNINIQRNVQDVTEYLLPWTGGSLPNYFSEFNADQINPGNGLDLSNGINGLASFNKDVNNSTGTAVKNQIIWFNFEGSTCGSSGINGNTGCTIRIDDNSLSEGITVDGSLMYETTIKGKKTVIIEGGNLYINSDMYYDNPSSDVVVFIVRRDRKNQGIGGNVYINPRVTNIVGSFIIDGTFMNFDGTSVLAQEGAIPATLLKLRRQLLVVGSIASSNSIGGSAKGTSSLCNAAGTTCTCPYGTDWEKQNGTTVCSATEASKYDLAALRNFQLRQSILSPGQTDTFTCDISPEVAVPTATSNPNYDETLYAWAGKKQCYETQPPVPGLATTTKENPMVIDFNKAILSADMGVLRKTDF